MSSFLNNVLQYLEGCPDPSQLALKDTQHSLTYSELQRRARAIGTALARTGARRQPIGVMIHRDLDSIVMFLGVVYSGNFYVPLDSAMPEERMQRMLSVLSPACVIGLDTVPGYAEAVPFFSYEALISEEPDHTLLQAIRDSHTDTDPLYALFTSGSTGTPKCVVISHRGVINLIEQMSACFPISRNDCFGNQAPFDFDVSTKDIYLSLRFGACLSVIPTELFTTPARLVEQLQQHGVTVIIWAVSALRIIAQLKAFRRTVPDCLRLIMFSGEVMPPKVLRYWREAIPEAWYVNLYGPTEITCNCTFHIIDRDYGDDEVIPIGRPFGNMRVVLLDSDGVPVPEGAQGEICVGGPGVALGYYRDPERTAAAFINLQERHGYFDRYYRTGDLGRYDQTGNLIFLSRKDNQIKHMGHRIELGEVEAAVNALSFIDTGCCIYDKKREKICLFYQASEACDRELLKALALKLPKYMWPNRLFWLQALPLNAHGKLDRVKLREEYL